MKNAVYSVIVPPDFAGRVVRAKQILRKNSNGSVLTYLMDQFEKNYAEEIETFERLFSIPEKDLIIEKGVASAEENPLF